MAVTAGWFSNGKTIVTTESVGVAFGVLFDAYPALKASRMNPIEALRYE